MWVLITERVRPHRLEVKSGSWGRSPLQRQGPKTPSFHIPGKTHGIWANLLHFVETTIITPIYISPSTFARDYMCTAEWAAVSFSDVCGVWLQRDDGQKPPHSTRRMKITFWSQCVAIAVLQLRILQDGIRRWVFATLVPGSTKYV